MWTKVEKHFDRLNSGRKRRNTFAVRRTKSEHRTPKLIIPGSYPRLTGQVDIYSDGNGRLAFCDAENGTYKVFQSNRASGLRALCIPTKFLDLIPYGTTDAEVTEEDGMLVLDTNQFSAPKFTAQAAE